MCWFFFKQKTAYEMRISDWSSDVCSSDLCRLQNDLCPTLISRIEMLVHIGPFRQFQAVRDDLRRLGAVVMDQLRKPAVIGFDVGLPGAYLLALEPERAEIEGHFAFLRQFIFRARILRNKDRKSTRLNSSP